MPAPTAARGRGCARRGQPSHCVRAERAAAAGVPSVYRPMGRSGGRPRRSSPSPRTLRRCVGGGDRRRPPRPDRAGRLDAPVHVGLPRSFPGMVVNLHPRFPGRFPVRMRSTTPGRTRDRRARSHRGHGASRPRRGCRRRAGARLATGADHADDTRETLEARLHEVEHELFVATIADYLRTR